MASQDETDKQIEIWKVKRVSASADVGCELLLSAAGSNS
jgi:hypothetical protein